VFGEAIAVVFALRWLAVEGRSSFRQIVFFFASEKLPNYAQIMWVNILHCLNCPRKALARLFHPPPTAVLTFAHV